GTGQAAFTVTSPDAGDHSLAATYAAQGNFAGSTSTSTLHVNAAATQVAISAPTVTYNSNGTVTVTVNAANGVPTPTGSVTLTVDGGNAQTVSLTSGQASFTITSPSAGNHTLNATYNPTSNYQTSSATGTLHVDAPPT